MSAQALVSATLLLAIRQTELQRGTLLVHYGRHPAALRPTEPRGHKITDRHARKVKARQYHPGNPMLDLDAHRHSAQRGIVVGYRFKQAA